MILSSFRIKLNPSINFLLAEVNQGVFPLIPPSVSNTPARKKGYNPLDFNILLGTKTIFDFFPAGISKSFVRK